MIVKISQMKMDVQSVNVQKVNLDVTMDDALKET